MKEKTPNLVLQQDPIGQGITHSTNPTYYMTINYNPIYDTISNGNGSFFLSIHIREIQMTVHTAYKIKF